MDSKGNLVCVDLFAGCGGLSLGLELSGFRPLIFCELNKAAGMTYLKNRPEMTTQQWIRDIGELLQDDAKILRDFKAKWDKEGTEIDLVCGGPPCQGFSGIGHRRSFAVDKVDIPSNHLFKKMIEVIRILKPRMFLFENVKGIMSGRWDPDGEKGEIWRDVNAEFKKLSKLGYHVPDGVLVSAADYGVPQNRPRVLLAGYRGKWEGASTELANGLLPKGREAAPHLEDILDDLVDPAFRPGLERTVTYPKPGHGDQMWFRKPKGKGRKSTNEVTFHEYSHHSPHITEKFTRMLAEDGVIPPEFQTKKFAQRVLPRRWDLDGGPGRPNITVTSLADDYVHYSQPRIPTVREWARMQTFPDWYQFEGPRTTGGHRRAGIPTMGIWDREVPQYTQIGNAVPVKLAMALGSHFRRVLAERKR